MKARIALGLGTLLVFVAVAAVAPRGPTLLAPGSGAGDSPATASAQGADIGNLFFFLDPADNNFAIIGMTVHSFIVPAMNRQLGNFDPAVKLRFLIENTEDAKPDRSIIVSFSPLTSYDSPQTATVRLPNKHRFTGPTTVPSSTSFEPLTIDPAVVTTDATSAVSVFAGVRDDPFFFDIPAALEYQVSRFNNAPNPSVFNRGRDSFAGYNTNLVALRVPVSLLKGTHSNFVGIEGQTMRGKRTLERFGFPGMSYFFVGTRPPAAPNCVGLTPTSNPTLKTLYAHGSPTRDAKGAFKNDIVDNLDCLRMSFSAMTFFLDSAVTYGDYLRLDVTVPNTGSPHETAGLGVPTTPGVFPPGGFPTVDTFHGTSIPNGRRPGDDVIDVVLTTVNNFHPVGAGCPMNPAAYCVDTIDLNDVAFESSFPYFARPHEPFPNRVDADPTRN